MVIKLSVSIGKKISMSGMMLLRWTDRSGQSQVLRLQQEMSPRWREMGQLLDISGAQLDGWETMHQKDQSRCLNSVIQVWMQRNSRNVSDL